MSHLMAKFPFSLVLSDVLAIGLDLAGNSLDKKNLLFSSVHEGFSVMNRFKMLCLFLVLPNFQIFKILLFSLITMKGCYHSVSVS